MTTIIDMVEADSYRREGYGITHTSRYIYRVEGARGDVHNPVFPHRVKVWDNTVRPDGSGKYIDPNGKSTDSPVSVLTSAGPLAITSSGTNTGTAASGRVYADVPLTIGETVRLRWPDGSLSDPYVVTPVPLDDPALVPASS